MAAKQKEVVIFQKKKKDRKDFIRDLNIFLSLVIILLSVILTQKIIQRKEAIKPPPKAAVVTKAVKGVSDVRVKIPILMYHYVEHVQDINDTIRISLNILPEVFESQIVTLKNDGYEFLTMQDIAAIFSGTRMPPEKAVVLTFDDGYKDFYEVVLPILQKHHIKAVSFVSPGLLHDPNYMDVSQVITVAKSGLVEIASHTVNHKSLPGSSLAEAYYEIYESKAQLEEMTGLQISSFAYPYGAFDDQAVTLVEKAGYSTAVTTLPGAELTREDRLVLDRLRPGRRTGEELLQYLKQDTFTAF